MSLLRRLTLPLVVLFALAASATPAWARWLQVEDFKADIQVEKDGSILVEERLLVDFHGSYNGIFRSLKIGYTYARGVRGTIRVEVLAIEDARGNALEHWKDRNDSYLNLKIRVPGANNAKREVVIRYRAQNVIRSQDYTAEDFGVMDELYWNVTGDEWDMPILHASGRITLPSDVPVDLVQAKAFTGRYGEKGGDFTLRVEDGPTILVETTDKLVAGEGLTAVVIFPPGHVSHPSPAERVGWWLQDNWFLVLPLLLLLLWWLAWRAWGRDPLKGRTIIAEWEPPEGMHPSEVGVLVDDSFDQRDLTATIVQLAVQGVITIHEEDGGDDFRLELHPEVEKKAQLRKHQKRLLGRIFDGDDTEVTLSSLKHEFVTGLKLVKNSVLDRLVSKGYFQKRPDRVVERWSGLTVMALIGLVILGVMITAPLPYWALAAVCVFLMFTIARQMPRRTKKGLDALARVKGMEEYLVTAEKERMQVLPLDHFEKLLPFAIALGVQKRWTKAFEGLFEKPPDWFRTTRTGFDSVWMNRSLNRMNSNVGSTLMSGPRAAQSSGSSGGSGGSGWSGGWSGGGGFSSGGSSGGGFGGGGGGGW